MSLRRVANALKSSGGEVAEPRTRPPYRVPIGRWVELGAGIDSWIQTHESLVLLLAIAPVTGFSLLFAWRQPFWLDEYFVLRTVQAGSVDAVWNVLKTAPLSVDPPLYHFLTMFCVRLFGSAEFVVRLPSV
ncbi:MAG: hypothetical protein FWD08_05075, partial [Alphaproteobacteria bacterium]|nr:hypothetical protein [Alphaproteobacteria bacterium]